MSFGVAHTYNIQWPPGGDSPKKVAGDRIGYNLVPRAISAILKAEPDGPGNEAG